MQDIDQGWVSLDWLVQRYAKLGVEFSDILAFERKAVSAVKFFAGVPANIVPRLHYYNVATESRVGSQYNPWTHVKALAEPGDFVVVKLDIDSPAIEGALIDQLLGDEQVGTVCDAPLPAWQALLTRVACVQRCVNSSSGWLMKCSTSITLSWTDQMRPGASLVTRISRTSLTRTSCLRASGVLECACTRGRRRSQGRALRWRSTCCATFKSLSHHAEFAIVTVVLRLVKVPQ